MIDSIGSGASVQSILNNIKQIREGFDTDSNMGFQTQINNTNDGDSFQNTFQNAIKSVSEA